MKPVLLAAAAVIFMAPGVRAQPGAPAGADQEDPALNAMQAEMARTMGLLRMDHLSKPYFVSYTFRQGLALILRAEFGALVERGNYPYGRLKVQVRTGSPSFDDTHFVGRDFWNYGPATGSTTFERQEPAVQCDLWSLTDHAYKTSLERLSAKKAYRQSRMIAEDIPDLYPAPAETLLEPIPSFGLTEPEVDFLSGRVRRLSAIFRKYPDIQSSNVSLTWSQQGSYFLNSEGTRLRRPSPWADIAIVAETQAKDGMSLQEERTFIAPSAYQLPAEELLAREAEEVGKGLSGLVSASTGTLYIGPVIFEGQAAAEFFNQLLAHNVSFPQEIWAENEDEKRNFETGALIHHVGTKVMSSFLDVDDDPALESYRGVYLAGHYRLDDEGVPAEKVSLVEHGILKDILMSRAPVKGHVRSNGHGRAGFYEGVTGRIGNLLIEPRQAVPASHLKKELLRLCREQELDYGLVVRRMATEEHKEPDHLLSPPVMVYKVYARDGREEPVRGLEFGEITLRALRDIVAASEECTVYNFYQLGPVQRNRGWVQASIVAPSILIREMELKPLERKPSRLPYLPHPYFEGKQ